MSLWLDSCCTAQRGTAKFGTWRLPLVGRVRTQDEMNQGDIWNSLAKILSSFKGDSDDNDGGEGGGLDLATLMAHFGALDQGSFCAFSRSSSALLGCWTFRRWKFVHPPPSRLRCTTHWRGQQRRRRQPNERLAQRNRYWIHSVICRCATRRWFEA